MKTQMRTALIFSAALMLTACSGGGEGASKVSPLDGTWVEENVWQSHEAAEDGKSKEVICDHLTVNSPGGEAVRTGTISLISNGAAYDCKWRADWKSSCEHSGSVNEFTISGKMEDGTNIAITMDMLNNITIRPSTVMINDKLFKAEEMMAEVTSQKRVPEQDIPKIHEIIEATCGYGEIVR